MERKLQPREERRITKKIWMEMYFQTAHDPSVSSGGLHHVSIFSQYVPYHFKEGTWHSRGAEVKKLVLDTLSEHCRNFPECIVDMEILGPMDLEREIGLNGGNIFHGEILPENMWEKRLQAKTGMEGFYMCGAGTHPGGSVIGINGRNAAMQIIKDEKK